MCMFILEYYVFNNIFIPTFATLRNGSLKLLFDEFLTSPTSLDPSRTLPHPSGTASMAYSDSE